MRYTLTNEVCLLSDKTAQIGSINYTKEDIMYGKAMSSAKMEDDKMPACILIGRSPRMEDDKMPACILIGRSPRIWKTAWFSKFAHCGDDPLNIDSYNSSHEG